MVCDFADTLCDDPPKGGENVGGDIMNCIKSTWDTTAMFEKFNLNFTIRYVLAVVTGFCFSKYYFNHVGTCAVLCTLLINKRVGPDMSDSECHPRRRGWQSDWGDRLRTFLCLALRQHYPSSLLLHLPSPDALPVFQRQCICRRW